MVWQLQSMPVCLHSRGNCSIQSNAGQERFGDRKSVLSCWPFRKHEKRRREYTCCAVTSHNLCFHLVCFVAKTLRFPRSRNFDRCWWNHNLVQKKSRTWQGVHYVWRDIARTSGEDNEDGAFSNVKFHWPSNDADGRIQDDATTNAGCSTTARKISVAILWSILIGQRMSFIFFDWSIFRRV